MDIRHQLGLYFRLIGVQMRSQMQYRAAFVLDSVTTGFTVVTSFVTLALILERFNNIGGWTLPEVALLYGLVETAFGSMDMIFSGFDPDNFGRQVQRGLLDQLMLRPVNLTVQVLGLGVRAAPHRTHHAGRAGAGRCAGAAAHPLGRS